jgi:hypothetical protein
MPETRTERLIFLLGLIAAGVLVALIVTRPRDSGTAGSPRLDTQAPAVTTTSTTTTGQTVTTATTAPATTTTAAGPVSLRLAAKADTWLDVRRSSPTGELLYQGTLAGGDSRTFTGSRFRVRFGAAANVSATLNGKPLPLPGGTYSVTIGSAGLGKRSA